MIEDAIAELKSKIIERARQMGLEVALEDLITVWKEDAIYVYPAEGTPGGPIYDEIDSDEQFSLEVPGEA